MSHSIDGEDVSAENPSAPQREPGPLASFICLSGIVLIMVVGLSFFDVELHILLIAAILWVGTISALHGYDFVEIKSFMSAGISRALGAFYIFILIGILIAAFIEGGTIATIVYYALDLINPDWFLPAGLLFCCFMSLSTGTSWGTAGTAGVVLVGIGTVLGVPLPIVAGVVVSGALFGDKMSPVSDTTNLAAACAGTDLYSHIRAMLYSTGPTFFVILLLYTLVGLKYSGGSIPPQDIDVVQTTLSTLFDVNLVTLAPLAVLLVMSFRGFSAEISMVGSVLVAIVIALLLQDRTMTEVMHSIQWGYTTETGQETIDILLNRGGIQSMMWTMSLALIALALGGIVDSVGFARVLMRVVIARIKRTTTLMAATITTGIAANMSMGENYLSIVVASQLFKDAYKKAGLQRRMLSRCVEEGGTLTAGLIPWTTTGAFFAGTLGVPTIEYAPWVLLSSVNIVMSLGLAALNVGVLRSDQQPSEAA